MKLHQLNNISLIILAGGKSSRMGRDKALLKFKGKTFVQILYDNLKHICSEVIISSNNPEVAISGTKTIADEYKEIGPMGGLYTCLKHSKTNYNIVVSVDTPFISAKLLSALLEKSQNYDISIIEHLNKTHPLIGVYHKDVLKILESEIKSKKYKVMTFLKKTKFQIINIDKIYKNELLNINNQEDYNSLTEE